MEAVYFSFNRYRLQKSLFPHSSSSMHPPPHTHKHIREAIQPMTSTLWRSLTLSETIQAGLFRLFRVGFLLKWLTETVWAQIPHKIDNIYESWSLKMMILMCSAKTLSFFMHWQLVVVFACLKLEAKLHIYTMWIV